MQTQSIDQARVEAFAMRAVADVAAAYTGVMVSLGSKLGLYRAMAGAGPLSAKELAARAGCAERYVREWLNAQAAGGYVGYHAASDTYELSAEHALVLADEDSPTFIPPAWSIPASMWFDEPQALEAFRTGRGVAWGEHDRRMSCGVAAFYRNGYRAALVPHWLPALDGVVERLQAGIAVVGSVMALIVLTGVVTAIQGIAWGQDADSVSTAAGLFSPWSLYTGVANAWDAGIDTFVPVDGAWVIAYVLVPLLLVGGCLLALVARFRKVGSR